MLRILTAMNQFNTLMISNVRAILRSALFDSMSRAWMTADQLETSNSSLTTLSAMATTTTPGRSMAAVGMTTYPALPELCPHIHGLRAYGAPKPKALGGGGASYRICDQCGQRWRQDPSGWTVLTPKPTPSGKARPPAPPGQTPARASDTPLPRAVQVPPPRPVQQPTGATSKSAPAKAKAAKPVPMPTASPAVPISSPAVAEVPSRAPFLFGPQPSSPPQATFEANIHLTPQAAEEIHLSQLPVEWRQILEAQLGLPMDPEEEWPPGLQNFLLTDDEEVGWEEVLSEATQATDSAMDSSTGRERRTRRPVRRPDWEG
jgi:hypothetical protein